METLTLEALLTYLDLDPRSARFLVARLVKGETLESIGQREGLTRERVRQICKKRIAACQRKLRAHDGWMVIVQRAQNLRTETYSLVQLAERLQAAAPLDGLILLLRLFMELDFPKPPPPETPSVGVIRSTILEAVSQLRLGTTTMVAHLRGRRWARLAPWWEKPGAGRLALCSEAQVRSVIDELLAQGRLKRLPWRKYGREGHILEAPLPP